MSIRGLDDVMPFAAARWELLTFPEVRDLLRGGRDRFVVLYEGDRPDADGWCDALTQAGFSASPIRAPGETGGTAP